MTRTVITVGAKLQLAAAVVALLVFSTPSQQLLAQSSPTGSAPAISAATADAPAPSAATAAPLAFDVASIRPDHSDGQSTRISTDADSFVCSGLSLKRLIAYAYNLNDVEVSGGPGWASSETYAIHAKLDESTAEALKKFPPDQRQEQRGLMVQALLADRFRLKVRRSNKKPPVYELVLTKKGPKFSQSPDSSGSSGGINGKNGQIIVTATPMSNFAQWLSGVVGRRVLDETGLQGKYSFTLRCSRENLVAAAGVGVDRGKGLDDSPGPSIFSALPDQLGLKLRSEKGPVETLIIDSAERPSEN